MTALPGSAGSRGAEGDFAAYLAAKRGDGKHPVKAATPMGDAAKEWGKQF